MVRNPFRLIGSLSLALSAAAVAQTQPALVNPPVTAPANFVGPVPNPSAAQLVPPDRRPIPNTRNAPSPIPTPEMARIPGHGIGSPLPNATNLPTPKAN